MRRVGKRLLLLVISLCLLTGTALADVLQEKTFAYTGARWASPNTDVATFWEAPTLAGGETCAGGQLILENTTEEPVTLTLTDIDLPYDNTEQMDYLNALRLQIRDDANTLLYNDAYSRVTSGDQPVMQVSLQPGQSRTYSLTLSCSFQYTTTLKNTPVISWRFDSRAPIVQPEPGFAWDSRTIALVACIAGASVFGILFIVLLVMFIRRKKQMS